MFKYIADNLSAEVNYYSDQNKIIKPNSNVEHIETSLRGTISPKGYAASFECGKENFTTYTSSTERKMISIKFETIPGYDLDEHNKEIIKLWDDVREQVKQYFEQRKD